MCGSPKNQLSEWTAYMTIMQMVARAMNPGCMARNVPVWEGEENKGKTRMIKLLGDPWAITFDMSMESKEAHMAIQGVWVAELAELDTLRKTTETKLKSFVSQTQDTFVPKYSNNRASLPRRTVFFGTTNDEDYLTSVTGNTRWFPIATGNFDYKRLERQREQLFAEAMSIFQENSDVAWWEEPCDIQSMLKAARDQRRSFNPYEESLSDWLDGKMDPDRIYLYKTSWNDIAKNFLKLDTPKEWKDKLLQMQVTSALKALGWKKKRAENSTYWARPGSSEANQAAEEENRHGTPQRSEYDDSGLEDTPNSGADGLPF
jgi:putative DNA primase/helicase